MTKQHMFTEWMFDKMILDQWRYWICERCNSKVYDKDTLSIRKIDGLSKIVCEKCVHD